MSDLKIAAIQSDLHWENPGANRNEFEDKIEGIGEAVDLAILPEMFTTGFTMNAAPLAEKQGGRTTQWMQSIARKHNLALCGSVIIEGNGRFYNRLLWVSNTGEIAKYDKRHLFRMAKEERVYSAGNERLLVDLNGWKICPFICYDLRFPVWSRSRKNEYDLMIFVANWPEKRSAHWRALLPARAIENQAFVVGVNRVGIDGNSFEFRGDSCVISPRGEIVQMESNKECTLIQTLKKSDLEEYRRTFPAWQDADNFELK